MTAHEVTVEMQKRIPLDPLRRAVCADCGPLCVWTNDAEEARSAKRRHGHDVARGVVLGGAV